MKKALFLLLFPALFTTNLATADTQSLTPSPNNSYAVGVVFPTLSGQGGEAYDMVMSGSYYRDGYNWSIPADDVMKYPGENFLWSISSTGTVTSVTLSLSDIQHRDSSDGSFTTKSITSSTCKNMTFKVGVHVGVIDVSYDAGTDTYNCRIS